jgi:hypothetical protein
MSQVHAFVLASRLARWTGQLAANRTYVSATVCAGLSCWVRRRVCQRMLWLRRLFNHDELFETIQLLSWLHIDWLGGPCVDMRVSYHLDYYNDSGYVDGNGRTEGFGIGGCSWLPLPEFFCLAMFWPAIVTLAKARNIWPNERWRRTAFIDRS